MREDVGVPYDMAYIQGLLNIQPGLGPLESPLHLI